MQKRTLILSAALALLCAPAMNAATVTLASVAGLDDGAFYIGPYLLNIDGVTLDAICYDSAREVEVGQTWQADLFTYDRLSSAYYSDQPDYIEKYRSIAWLVNRLLTTDLTAAQSRTDLQHAIWGVFNARVPEASADSLIAEATTAAQDPDLDVSRFRVVNAVAGETQRQGFIVDASRSDLPDTPEPATWMLMAVGLMTLGFWQRSRNRFS